MGLVNDKCFREAERQTEDALMDSLEPPAQLCPAVQSPRLGSALGSWRPARRRWHLQQVWGHLSLKEALFRQAEPLLSLHPAPTATFRGPVAATPAMGIGRGWSP